MAIKNKKGKNPVLDSCAGFIQKEEDIRNQKAAQYKLISEAQAKIRQLEAEAKFYHKNSCKEITDEILSRDLQLNDIEYAFLTMPIKSIKTSKEPSIGLLECLVRRCRNNLFFVYKDPRQSFSLFKIQKIIGFIDEKVFIKSLNKKLDNILKFKLARFVYDPDYLKKLKSPVQERIAIEIEFIYQNS